MAWKLSCVLFWAVLSYSSSFHLISIFTLPKPLRALWFSSILLSLVQCSSSPINAKFSCMHLHVFLDLPTGLPSTSNLPKPPSTVLPCFLHMFSPSEPFPSEHYFQVIYLTMLVTSALNTLSCHLIPTLYLSTLPSFALNAFVNFLVRVHAMFLLHTIYTYTSLLHPSCAP